MSALLGLFVLFVRLSPFWIPKVVIGFEEIPVASIDMQQMAKPPTPHAAKYAKPERRDQFCVAAVVDLVFFQPGMVSRASCRILQIALGRGTKARTEAASAIRHAPRRQCRFLLPGQRANRRGFTDDVHDFCTVRSPETEDWKLRSCASWVSGLSWTARLSAIVRSLNVGRRPGGQAITLSRSKGTVRDMVA